VDRVGVGGREATGGVHGVGDPEILRRIGHELVHDGRDDRPAREHGPAADLVLAELLLLHARVIGGEGDIDRDGHLRPDAVRHRACPTALVADLLLCGGHGDDRGRTRIGGVAARRFEHHERADAVGDGAGGDTAVGEFEQGLIDHARVADGDHRIGFGA
jgi:hypothetical protein